MKFTIALLTMLAFSSTAFSQALVWQDEQNQFSLALATCSQKVWWHNNLKDSDEDSDTGDAMDGIATAASEAYHQGTLAENNWCRGKAVIYENENKVWTSAKIASKIHLRGHLTVDRGLADGGAGGVRSSLVTYIGPARVAKATFRMRQDLFDVEKGVTLNGNTHDGAILSGVTAKGTWGDQWVKYEYSKDTQGIWRLLITKHIQKSNGSWDNAPESYYGQDAVVFDSLYFGHKLVTNNDSWTVRSECGANHKLDKSVYFQGPPGDWHHDCNWLQEVTTQILAP